MHTFNITKYELVTIIAKIHQLNFEFKQNIHFRKKRSDFNHSKVI